jgi:hypothetical protein
MLTKNQRFRDLSFHHKGRRGEKPCDANIHSSVSTLWPNDQSSRLQIQRSGFDSRRYLIFWEVVGLERGPLSLVSTIGELLEIKSSGSGL